MNKTASDAVALIREIVFSVGKQNDVDVGRMPAIHRAWKAPQKRSTVRW